MSVRVWGKNLSNEDYAVQLYTLAQGDGINIAPGRTFGVSFDVKF
jgi:outer membrane receptor protein involved in Fe transport